jgi:hypothetical protein
VALKKRKIFFTKFLGGHGDGLWHMAYGIWLIAYDK